MLVCEGLRDDAIWAGQLPSQQLTTFGLDITVKDHSVAECRSVAVVQAELQLAEDGPDPVFVSKVAAGHDEQTRMVR